MFPKVVLATFIVFGIGIGASVLACHSTFSDDAPRRNLACVVAHQLNLENPIYEELVTGWGFTPDTCVVQAATMTGTVRVPTQVVWCAVGTGAPECKMLYDLRQPPKKQ